jgi:hypothetical protein
MIVLSFGLIFGTAYGTLQQVLEAADRQHRDDEEDRDESHAPLFDEGAYGAAVPALHLVGRRLWSPREKMHADD